MQEEYLKKILNILVLGVLLVLAFFLLKPLLLSIILGVILAFIFNPIYKLINKRLKSKNFSAIIICSSLIILILLPIWFFTPIIIDQSFKVYQASQKIDFGNHFNNFFPAIFSSENFSNEIGSTISSFVSGVANKLVNFLGELILNFATFFFKSIVVFFTFFFVLRDKNELILYLKSLSPFSKSMEKKFLESSKNITASVIYGQVIVGVIQGLITGLGFFIFGVPNALFLTLLATLAGIFPIIGTTIIWIPVAIYLISEGNTLATFGVIIFGVVSSSVDNFLRPMIVAKRTNLHVSVLFVGMIGGLFLFGVLGFILGPLILAYLLILLEIYRNKPAPNFFIQKEIK
jgi:predicted PurR-regulated permease PerM